MKNLLFLVVLISMLGCKTQSGLKDSCETSGIIKDMAGLDGCGLLIELPNGDLLNPVKLPAGVQLKDQQRISFSYKVLEDMAGICMAEKAQVEITCFKVMPADESGNGECADVTNPFEVEWMDRAIDRYNPNQIIKYRDGKHYFYLFNAITSSYLYDCEGKLICETRNDDDDCHSQYIRKFGKGKVIWQGEGVWD